MFCRIDHETGVVYMTRIMKVHNHTVDELISLSAGNAITMHCTMDPCNNIIIVAIISIHHD